ncbi:7344_t:CDS:2, partial [Funneliformis caledonium]
AIRNKFVNQYPLEIGLYLTASGASCDAINTMHNAGISVCYKTVENYKKKIANVHPENIRKYFTEKNNSFFVYNLDDYHNIHRIRRPDTVFLSTAAHFATCV